MIDSIDIYSSSQDSLNLWQITSYSSSAEVINGGLAGGGGGEGSSGEMRAGSGVGT